MWAVAESGRKLPGPELSERWPQGWTGVMSRGISRHGSGPGRVRRSDPLMGYLRSGWQLKDAPLRRNVSAWKLSKRFRGSGELHDFLLVEICNVCRVDHAKCSVIRGGWHGEILRGDFLSFVISDLSQDGGGWHGGCDIDDVLRGETLRASAFYLTPVRCCCFCDNGGLANDFIGVA